MGSIATAGPSGAPTAGPSKKPTSSSSNNDNSLSGGAIAGIVIGAVVFAGLVVVAVLVLSGVLTTAPPAVVKNVSGVQMASAAPTAPASDGPMPVTDAAPIGVESVAENA